jgi:hypothetical protein
MRKFIHPHSIFITFLFCLFFPIRAYHPLCANQARVNPDSQKHLFKLHSPPLAFVILCHVRDENDEKLWKRCYHSVREFYPNHLIVLIDDNSQLPLSGETLKNTLVIRSEYPGAGELLPYYYFLKGKWAKKIVILHDSMFLRRPFYEEELNDPIKFHWHFEIHIWDDDPLINTLLSHLKHSEKLIDYNVNKKSLWFGCFGVTSVIDLKLLQKIERKYDLAFSLIKVINCRVQRCALERIFGMIMFKEGYISKENCSNFGDIINYPTSFMNADDKTLEYLKISYPGAILKTWLGR